MPWYIFASMFLLPVAIIHFLRTPRERWKREFVRVDIWWMAAGYAIFWANHRYEWWKATQDVPELVWWSVLLLLIVFALLWKMKGNADRRQQFVRKFRRVDAWLLLGGAGLFVIFLTLVTLIG